MVIHHFNRLIRNKWVWGVFAVMISAFFAFDFLFSDRSGERGGEGAGKMDGESVTRAKFEEIRQDVQAEMRLQPGRPRKPDEINKEVWSRLAMLKVAEELKLTADDEQVRAAVLQGFQDETGAFSKERYQEFCAGLRWEPERFETFVRRELTFRPIQKVAATASWVSPLEISNAVRDGTDKITVRVARFQQKPDAVKPEDLDEAAFKEYYESNTNSLALPELKVVRYVKVPADGAEDVEVTEEELRDFFNENRDRYGTNEFETVRGTQVEQDFRLDRALEAACGTLRARVCPEGVADDGVDRLAQLADAEKQEIKTSRPFALSDTAASPFDKKKVDLVRAGFMVDVSDVLPVEKSEFVNGVKDIDPDMPSERYHMFKGSNAVYVVGLVKDLCTEPRVLTLDEIKGNSVIRDAALADLKAKEFKKAVDKVREAVKDGLAKGADGTLEKIFGDANISTSITYNVSTSMTFVARTAMGSSAIPDMPKVVPAAIRLSKGELSELLLNDFIPGNGLVVYVEDRQPGAAGDAAEQMRTMLSGRQSMFAVQSWNESNMARLGVQPSAWTSMKELKDDDDADDGEGSQD